VEPPAEAMAWAWDFTRGSWIAYMLRMVWRMPVKVWFSLKDCGVGGIWVVVPTAREGVGGEFGRSESVCELSGPLCTY